MLKLIKKLLGINPTKQSIAADELSIEKKPSFAAKRTFVASSYRGPVINQQSDQDDQDFNIFSKPTDIGKCEAQKMADIGKWD